VDAHIAVHAAAFSASVVIPAYNVRRYLPRAIQSVLNQTLPPLEVVVVDDGSSDGTGEVARRFGGIVRCVRQENAGAGAARNHGVREARGEFVAFLDADDEWCPHHLDEAARVLTAHPELDWLCAPYEERDASGKPRRRRKYAGPQLKHGVYIAEFFKAHVEYWFAWTSTMVVRRQVVLEAGGFDESMRRGQDLDLWCRIALRHPRIGYSPHLGAIYWRRAGSISDITPGAELQPLLTRIEKLDKAAAQLGQDAVKRSEPVVIAWVGGLIRLALYEGKRELARDFYTRYRRRMALADRLLMGAFRFVPGAWLARLYAIFLFKVVDTQRAFRQILRKASGRWRSR
jgi:glycosyltransferase involved in cell wall biosynthesis